LKVDHDFHWRASLAARAARTGESWIEDAAAEMRSPRGSELEKRRAKSHLTEIETANNHARRAGLA
jgi:hypothetical protein